MIELAEAVAIHDELLKASGGTYGLAMAQLDVDGIRAWLAPRIVPF